MSWHRFSKLSQVEAQSLSYGDGVWYPAKANSEDQRD